MLSRYKQNHMYLYDFEYHILLLSGAELEFKSGHDQNIFLGRLVM